MQRGSTVTPLLRPTDKRLASAFLDCHSEGHQWRHVGKVDPLEAEPGMRPPWGSNLAAGRRSHCTSCSAERIRWYTRSGEVVNRYRYADGYLHKKVGPDDDPAPSRLEWRQALVVTLFEDFGAAVKSAPKRRQVKASA